MKSKEFITALQSSTDGIREGKTISYEQFGMIPVPIASLPEQRRITTFLDRETAKIDTLIEKQERLIALLGEKRQAVISHAVTKGLDPNAAMKDTGGPLQKALDRCGAGQGQRGAGPAQYLL